MYGFSNAVLATGLLIVFGCYVIFRSYLKLRHIPGPFWARLTNIQRILWVRSGRAHVLHQHVHQQFGDVVRFGPNMVSVSDPAAIATIYPTRTGIPKGDFYRTLMPYTPKGGALPAVFNTRDEALHRQIKTPIAPLFSMSNVLRLEPFVDQVLEVFFRQLEARFVEPGVTCDFADWLQYFAFDVMGTLTFSKQYGFLDMGKDVNDMLATIWAYMKNAAPMTQIPWFDTIWRKNPIAAMFRSAGGFTILKIVNEYTSERQVQHTEKGDRAGTAERPEDGDMLSRFIEIQSNDPSIPSLAVRAWSFSNIIAGSDSTAVVMRTVWYNLLAHPSTMRRLYNELIDTEKASGISRPFPKWNEVRGLPYLDACINEAARLHPPFCLPFERVVPEQGLMVCGKFLPPRTIVGMNPYVVNRHKPTFGENADHWCPERWMGIDFETRKRMEQRVLTVIIPLGHSLIVVFANLYRGQFGAGRRVCLGKYIALMELKKLTSALALNYQIELVDPSKFTLENAWFFRQYGLDVKAERRKTES